MNHRPINTLEEDFAALGLIEQGSPDEMDPRQKMLAMKQAKLAKQQAMLAGKRKPGMTPEDIDLDGDDLEEMRLMRAKKLRGAAKMASHKAAKMYYKLHKAVFKRRSKTAKAKRHRKMLAKAPKAMKGYRRMLPDDVNLGSLGGNIKALGEGLNGAALQQEFVNIYRYATEISGGYGDLIDEDYISSVVSYPEMQESAQLMAHEAQTFAKALADHDEYLSVADQALLQTHAEQMIEHLDGLGEVLSQDQTAIAIDEGEFDPEIHDVEFAYAMGVPVMESEDLSEKDYGEMYLEPVEGWGNDPDDSIYNVMGPMGISRAGHREKLVLAKQLKKETAEDVDLDNDVFWEDDDLSLDDIDEDLIAEARRRKRKWYKGSEGDLGKYVTNDDGNPYFIQRKYASSPPKPFSVARK